MRVFTPRRWCCLAWLASSSATSATPDIDAWADPSLHEPGVACEAEAQREWPTDPRRGVGWNASVADASAAAAFASSIDLDVEWERDDLVLSRRVDLDATEPVLRLAVDELSCDARAFVGGDSVGGGVDVAIDPVGAGPARSAVDAYVSAFWHPHAREERSWMVYVIAGNRPYWGRERALPGLAYCFRGDGLTLEAGLPLASATWRPRDWLSLAVTVGDGAKGSLTASLGSLSATASAGWSRRFFRVRDGSAADPAVLDEAGLALEVDLPLVGDGLRCWTRAQWSPLRRLRDESSGASASLGRADGAALGLELDL